ncbi:MAG: DUF2062 domain-containing protein [Bacteroidales bacterium]|jgi:glycosyltransferase involved in cell wall biosynthesis|nr:DUF2062 domain-containing protein [Bacteroidales bacterium]MDD4215061.1 DUF2062 domain-containing protein [Bacteroidales bacterium]
MTELANNKALFDEMKCCVVVPTYNNVQTLGKVIDGILKYTDNVIVVNDGSTDETVQILQGYNHLNIISYTKNKGKGYALRKAFKQACLQGYMYCITLDSDGQHSPDDLMLFIEKIKEEPEALIIGSRNMKSINMPGKNSFANKFSNFWFYIETGRKIPDTQSGYRAYPLFLLNKKHYFGLKYEFEVEVLVRAAWSGVNIIHLPINVVYYPKEERISHFRPFWDFFRISILNTFLVLIAFLFIKPFSFINSLKKEKVKTFLQKYVVNSNDSNFKIAASVMVGVFSGIAPVWGWQWGLALLLAFLFKLNKVLSVVATNISVPPMIPVVIYLSYIIGGYAYHYDAVSLEYSQNIGLHSIKINIIQYVIGSFILATITSLVIGIVTYILLRFFRKKVTLQKKTGN